MLLLLLLLVLLWLLLRVPLLLLGLRHGHIVMRLQSTRQGQVG